MRTINAHIHVCFEISRFFLGVANIRIILYMSSKFLYFFQKGSTVGYSLIIMPMEKTTFQYSDKYRKPRQEHRRLPLSTMNRFQLTMPKQQARHPTLSVNHKGMRLIPHPSATRYSSKNNYTFQRTLPDKRLFKNGFHIGGWHNTAFVHLHNSPAASYLNAYTIFTPMLFM